MRIRLFIGAILGVIAAQNPPRGVAASLIDGASFVAERQLVAHPGMPFPPALQLVMQATWPSGAVSSFRMAEDAAAVPGTPPVPGNATAATPSLPMAKVVGTDSANAEKAPKPVAALVQVLFCTFMPGIAG